jgi:hypothetical protein
MLSLDLSSGGINASAKPKITKIGRIIVKMLETAVLTPVRLASDMAIRPSGIMYAAAISEILIIITYLNGFMLSLPNSLNAKFQLINIVPCTTIMY